MRTMYDAVTAANITKANSRPQMVAGYVDKIKLEPWSAADWARFPDARKVEIVKKASTNAGHVLDVEPGDATPEQAPGWAAMRRRSGFAYPVIYCNRSTWPKVKAAFAAQGVEPPLYWIATASGRPEIPAGAIAAQYLLDVAPGIDVSAVADYWPGVDPAPGTNSNKVTEDSEMPTFGTPAPAGVNEHVDLAVVGCTKLRLHTSWGAAIQVHDILFYGDTSADLTGTGVGGGYDDDNHGGKPWQWDPNRPGPIDIPAKATTVTVRYDAKHAFYVSAASA
ncbi:hypothetical protein [Amycolatopsis lexingtonensis]|uniref:hypothetical protein n=1 Tax=Amycolatopsis lexingtonensis TaxID=218822 RepID=UPI003F72137A